MSEVENSAKESSAPQTSVQWQPPRLRWLLIVPLLMFTGIWWARNNFGDATPILTTERSRAAQARWQAAGIQNYELRVELRKQPLEVYETRVRNGEAERVLLNGSPIKEKRVMETWTVPGMFTTLSDDLAHVAAYEQGTATKTTPRLRLWCAFDAATGVPLKYRRLEWDKSFDITWQITKFEKLD